MNTDETQIFCFYLRLSVFICGFFIGLERSTVLCR